MSMLRVGLPQASLPRPAPLCWQRKTVSPIVQSHDSTGNTLNLTAAPALLSQIVQPLTSTSMAQQTATDANASARPPGTRHTGDTPPTLPSQTLQLPGSTCTAQRTAANVNTGPRPSNTRQSKATMTGQGNTQPHQLRSLLRRGPSLRLNSPLRVPLLQLMTADQPLVRANLRDPWAGPGTEPDQPPRNAPVRVEARKYEDFNNPLAPSQQAGHHQSGKPQPINHPFVNTHNVEPAQWDGTRMFLGVKIFYKQRFVVFQHGETGLQVEDPAQHSPTTFTTLNANFATPSPVNVLAIKKQTAAAQRHPTAMNGQVTRLSRTPGYTSVHQNYQVISAAAKMQAYRPRDCVNFTTSLSFRAGKKVGSEVIQGIYKTVSAPVDVRPRQLKEICYNALRDLIIGWGGVHAPSIDQVRLTRGNAEFLDDPDLEDVSVILFDCYSAPGAKNMKTSYVQNRQVGPLKKQLNKTDSPFLSITEDEFQDILGRMRDEALMQDDDYCTGGDASNTGSRWDNAYKNFDDEPSPPKNVKNQKRTRQAIEAEAPPDQSEPSIGAHSKKGGRPGLRPRPGRATNPILVDEDDKDLPDLPKPKRRAGTKNSSRPLFIPDDQSALTERGTNVQVPVSSMSRSTQLQHTLSTQLPAAFDYGKALKALGESGRARGDADFVKKAINVTIYPLAYLPFSKLLEQSDSDKASTIYNELTAVQGKLEVLDFLNSGSFKTANWGKLSHQAPLPSNNTSILSHPQVVVKQPILRQPDGKSQVLPANLSLDSLTVAACELQCANALMKITHDHIEQAMGKDAMQQLPQVRFVAAGIAVAVGICRAYLLEECIDPQIHGEFVKYISNNTSKVLTAFLCNHEEQERGLYLAATQHVQYEVTKGYAFVSDLQGAGGLLTDPQILTHPDLGELFGDGNVSSTWSNFRTDHSCNKYCKMFKLLPFVSSNSAPIRTRKTTVAKTSTPAPSQSQSVQDD
ncbi:hypothetical protein M407DRAFT_22525 [Tulasnella calospora MUT 4182]|uniref:Alpha-type protein kinase domain-containing protein n=1 Tax=Tulasnella calospora MUT 4182 TaxID=1051891 RepID=A0A0C3M3U9_9AGAM|nr:hypothetical protein M407DRAFT_22525 [Tulasnella calospora MUT 4182]